MFSIRVILCVLVVGYFSVYAWKNYFVSLLGAIVLMAIMQHPDVVENLKSIGGIPGANLWNILMFNVTAAWLSQRRAQGLEWDMPRAIRFTLLTYIIFVLWSGTRLLFNYRLSEGYTFSSILSEDFVDCLKWYLPMFILFDACRTRERIVAAAGAITGLFVLLALQVIKHVPPRAAISSDFEHVAYKMVQDSVGYNRVTLSMMLGGASWGTLACLPLAETRRHKFFILAAAGAITLGQALTGGRSGYASWIVVGLILGFVRWRWILVAVPAAVLLVCICLPQVRERALQGLSSGSDQSANAYDVSSGRNIAWPFVIDKIKESPIWGFGREAMVTAGVYEAILTATNGEESFPHPHNAYLQILLDGGIIGFCCVIPFYFIVVKRSFSLFRDKRDPLFGAIGGMTVAMVLALLVASLGGETLYPREGAVGLWAAVGLMLRVWVERQRAEETGTELFDETPAEHDGDNDIIDIEESTSPA